jgi:hypothetical protein
MAQQSWTIGLYEPISPCHDKPKRYEDIPKEIGVAWVNLEKKEAKITFGPVPMSVAVPPIEAE